MSDLFKQKPTYCPKCGNKLDTIIRYAKYSLDIDYSEFDDSVISIPFTGICSHCGTKYYWYYKCSLTVKDIETFDANSIEKE